MAFSNHEVRCRRITADNGQFEDFDGYRQQVFGIEVWHLPFDPIYGGMNHGWRLDAG